MKTLKKLLLGLGVGVMLFGSANALAASYTVVKEPWLASLTGTRESEYSEDGIPLYAEFMPFVDGKAIVYTDVFEAWGEWVSYYCYGNYYTVDAYGNTSEPRSDLKNSLWVYDLSYDTNHLCDPDNLYSDLKDIGYTIESFTPQKYTKSDGYYVSESETWHNGQEYRTYQACLTNGYAIVSKDCHDDQTNFSWREYAMIDRDENIVVPFGTFDYITPYVSPEGLVWVEKDGKYGIIKVGDNAISVNVNGANVEFDVAPRIINSRTLVPLRAIFQALGATVDWDSTTQTVTSVKGDITVKMQIGSNTLYKNGNAATIDVAPQIIENRTLIPVRAIAEAFGNKVDWNSETKTVTIYN